MVGDSLAPILTAIVAGIILLIIEYRTAWFQKYLSGLKSKTNNSRQLPSVSTGSTISSHTLLLRPSSVNINVEDEAGNPVGGVHILLVAKNGTYLGRKTGFNGMATIDAPKQHLVTVFCAHENFPAYIVRDFDPANDLLIKLHRIANTGSIICPNGTGHIPGLEGYLNPIRDTLNRLYLYATNIAIEGGKQQPVGFKLGDPLEIEDCNGKVFQLKIIEVIGASSLLEFTEQKNKGAA